MKYLWIMEKSSTQLLFYYSTAESKLDEFLVSGFLSALNSFSEVELGRDGIHNIDMGNLRLVYSNSPDYNLMTIAADDPDSNPALMLSRLEIIKKMFVQTFGFEKGDLDGTPRELNQFLPFEKTVSTLLDQWKEAESMMNVGVLFDLLGVFQQIFILLIRIIDDNFTGTKYCTVLEKIDAITPQLMEWHEARENPDSFRLIQIFIPKVDLEKVHIEFNIESGMNVLSLNPIGLDESMLKPMLFIVLINYKSVIEEKMGTKKWLFEFNKKVRPYLFSNWDFLNELGIMKELLEIFMEEGDSDTQMMPLE